MGQFSEQSRPFQGPPAWTRPLEISQLKEEGILGIQSKLGRFHGSTDASLFSSSLPVMFHEKLNLGDEGWTGRSVDPTSSHSNELEGEESFQCCQKAVPQAIDNLLPDDEDELLAGIMDDFDLTGLSSQVEELEECDLFSSGGGMELDSDSQEGLVANIAKARISDSVTGVGNTHHGISNGPGTVAGEHPYGEHPSRTLFVRNINSNVEDSELRALFEQYGAIRTLYTACKHRGFVMISYYDIRAARSAMRALQNKPLRRRKLDIHFSIPKDNPSDKDINQGTLVVFNLDASVSNDDLRLIFGAYGEVKEIRETPHKRHHKFIEFYDVRAAEAALRALNRSDIAGKRIKLEPSRPGGARRSLMQQLSMDLEQDETNSYRQQVGFPPVNSPPGPWTHFSSPADVGSLRNMEHSHGIGIVNSMVNKPLSGLAGSLPPLVPASSKVGTIGNDLGRHTQVDPPPSVNSAGRASQVHHSHSLPEYNSGKMHLTHYNSGTVPVMGSSTRFGPHDEMGISSNGSYCHTNTTSGGVCSLSGPQFLWGSPGPYSHHMQSSAWPVPSFGHQFNVSGCSPLQGYSYSGRQGSYGTVTAAHHHHAGSAPSGDPSLERHMGYLAGSPSTCFVTTSSFGGMGVSCSNGSSAMNIGKHGALNAGPSMTSSGSLENGPQGFGVTPSQYRVPMLAGGGFPGSMVNIGDELNDQGRNRCGDNNMSQTDNKKQYQLDLEKILRGEDTRTTLMIKNIPNKYTSKMLLAAIDEYHPGTYDFLYLPIDFKNKCNVGYAFINMTSPSHIINFHQTFNGKKWEKFNSEKVASLAYARIQGKVALVAHFQNSSLMNEDKRCRPILFHSEGQEASDQELFPVGANLRAHQREHPDSTDQQEILNTSGSKADIVPGNVENTSIEILSVSGKD